MDFDVKIFTDRTILDKYTLPDILHIKSKDDEGVEEDLDLSEILEAERSVLIESSPELAASVYLTTARYEFRNFLIVAECPKFEIFIETNEEYLDTHFGEIIQDLGCIKIFCFQIKIPKSKVNNICIKFLPGSDKFWIHYIEAQVVPSQKQILSQGGINYENVQDILQNSSTRLSPNAEHCKKFVENFMKSNRTASVGFSGVPTMQTLFNLLQNNNSRQLDNLTLNNIPLLNGNNSVLDQPGENLKKSSEGKESNNNEVNEEKYVNSLKVYIDQKFLEMENKFSQRFKQIEGKQNLILDAIKNLNTIQVENNKENGEA